MAKYDYKATLKKYGIDVDDGKKKYDYKATLKRYGIDVDDGRERKVVGKAEKVTYPQKEEKTNQKVGASASLPSAASGKAETTAPTKKGEETPRWKQLLASTNEKGKAVESGQAKAETKPFETRTRGLTRARAGDADALATREMKLGNTERVKKDNPYANALAAAWHSVESGYANTASMVQQGAAKIEEAYAPYAGTSHAREEMGYQTTKEDAAKKNRAAYELTQGEADRLSEQAAEEMKAAKEGQGTIGGALTDLGVQGVQMGTDIAAATAMGIGALVPMMARVFGQGAQEARQEGASYEQQLAYGAALAAVEAVTEKMFDGVAGAYGKGWFGEMKSAKQLAAALNKKLASRPAGRAALKLLGSMAGEGAEELASGIVNPIAKMIYNGRGIKESYRENFDWSETLYEGLIGALMGGLGGTVEALGAYQDGRMKRAAEAIDRYYDAVEKTGPDSDESAMRAREAENILGVTARGEKSSPAESGEAAAEESAAKIAENGTESARETARATEEETTTSAEATEEQRDALEEERSRFYTYLLSGGGTETAVNENLGKMKGDALRKAEQYVVEALNNGDIIEENGVYRRSDARVETERRFEREKELRQSGIHGDTGWMSRKDAAHMEQLARTGGVSVEIVDTLGDAQGTYDPRTGRIQIARDATDPVGFVIRHELTHRMKQSSPEKWNEFLGYVQKHYGESWEDAVEDYRRRYAEHNITLTAEEAAEEVAADFAGRMDQEDIRRLTQENRSLAQKILDAIRSLIRRLKGGENQRLYEMEKLWASALKEGKENTAERRSAESTSGWGTLQSRENGATINENATKTEEGTNDDESRTSGAGSTAQESGQNGRRKGAVQGTATEAVRRGTVLGGQRELTPSFGEKPRRTWAEGHTVEPVHGSAAYAEQQIAMEYGVPSFVVADDVWDANKGKTPAFSANGQIYFREGVPPKNAGMLAYHELTHVMKQVGYEPYLKFTKGVAERLNMNSDAAHLLLEHEARHRKIDIFGEDGKLDLQKLHRLGDAERLKLYDELNAVLYGHIGSGKLDGLSGYLEAAFYDFPSYTAELRKIHEEFKQRANAERNAAGENAKENKEKKLSLKSYTEEEKKQHIEDAAAYFGKTEKWSETGYITTDGGRLDFSGRHEGGSGGYRTVDHRDIRDALGDDYGGDDYGGSMVQFMSEGNIRVSPESGGIDLSVKPTKAQEAALSDFISEQRGEVILDLDTPDGRTVSGAEYPRGTSASKVLADIRAYFEDGTEPQVSEAAKYRYSLKGSKNAAEEAERLRAQNERLTQELDALSKELRRADDRLRTETANSTDRGETGKAAAELLKRFGSKANRAEITSSLLKLYDGMALGEMSRKEMKEQARAIADEVIDHVEENINPLHEEYKELRDTLKTDKVTLPVEYRADIQDGYNEVRKRAFGKVKIGNDGTPVDVQYEMLNDRYPELFPSDIVHPADQLERMVEVAGSLQKEMGSPYQGAEGEDVRQSLANDVLEQFFDISTTQTAKLMGMQRKWEKQRENDRRATDERFRKSRERQKERLEKLEKSFQERDRKRREKATAGERRKQIAAGVEKMTRQLIRPTDKKHIPAEMQETVMAFVSTVNTESDFEWKMNPDGTYSKKRVKTGEGAPTARTVRARELKDALEQLQKSKTKDGEAATEYTIDPSLRENIDRIIDMGEKKLTEMTREELDTVWETYCAISAMVKNSDRMLGDSKYARVSEAAEALRTENGWRRDRRTLRGRLKTLDELVNLDTMTAETFFHKLGKAGDELFRAMRNAADQQTRIVKEGTDLAARAVKDSGVKVKELEKKKETFRLESGEALTLTKAQLMELYELAKREQAQGHIFGVGIVPDKVDSGLLTEERSEAVRVTMNDVGKMLETLTTEEKKLADALQRYMSGALAMHGNEASRAVYGYDKFTEQHYWPIKVNKGETKTDAPKEAKSKTIPSFGMTNATIQDAKNGIVLRSFMDSFTEHLNQMATYSAWLATSEDLSRVHNFAFLDEGGEQTGKTTKTLIKKVFGDGGDRYWDKLMQDIALGTKAGAESNPMNKFFSNYKAAAVGFNARVVLQQPTAILRAMTMIHPRYLAEGMVRKGGWEKALKHSPLAQWKDWGYFELDNGKSLRELIAGSENAAEKLRSASMAGAGWGDSVAWGALWNAIEAETEATKRSVAPGSEEFYRIVNDRFEDVIYRTQVVDSVLNRSQAMRKSGWNLFTSFMGEPMKTANMVQRSIYDMTRAVESGNAEAKKAAGRSIGRTALSVAASWAVNALMQSIADVFRDDDRDEKTSEKYLGKWVKNFVSNLNPTQYIPFIRDLWSIMEGYDVERMDMAAFADAWKAWEAALKAWDGDGKKTKGFASLDLVMQLCKTAGLPVANLERDIEDLIIGTLLQAGQWQALYAFDKMKFSTESNKTHYYESLYYAMLDDWEAYEEVYQRMLEDGFEEKAIKTGIENRVKKALGADGVDELPARWGAPGTAQGQTWKRYVEQSGEVLGKAKDQIEEEEKQREKEKKKEEKEKEKK